MKIESILALRAPKNASDDEIIDLLQQIISEESAKPAGESDSELIDEATLLCFRLINAETVHYRNNNADDTSEKNKKGKREKKAARKKKREENKEEEEEERQKGKKKKSDDSVSLPLYLKLATVFTVICTVFLSLSVAANTYETDIFGLVMDAYYKLVNAEPYERDDGTTLIVRDGHSEYKSLEELYENKNYTGYCSLPAVPEGYQLTYASSSGCTDDYNIIIIFNSNDGQKISIDITNNEYAVSRVPSDVDTRRMGDFDVMYACYNQIYDEIIDDIYQAEWIYNDIRYSVQAPSYELLETTIINFKEIK